MNTNPNAKVVLCYGDSNTWGRLPDRSGRYAVDERWTGQLQKLLGDDYYVIEEGLGGRTTDLDDRGGVRNGKTYLLPCLESHNPIDVVIIMLGTNDFKFRFNRSANDIAAALQGLVEMVNATVKNGLGDNTKIVLISPAHINVDAPRFMEFYGKDYDLESGTASTLLGKAIKDVALHAGCEFFDASEVAIVGEDGLHLNLESQARLAEKIAELVQ